jgi:hypothetical protein
MACVPGLMEAAIRARRDSGPALRPVDERRNHNPPGVSQSTSIVPGRHRWPLAVGAGAARE